MTRIILRGAAFVAGLMVLLAGASLYYEHRVREADLHYRQVKWFSNPSVQPIVLFIGDSRIAMDVSPELLPPGYINWSFPGDTLRHIALRARYAMATKPSLKYLVIGLDDITLSQKRAILRDAVKSVQFARFSDIADVYQFSVPNLLKTVLAYYVPVASAGHRRLLVQTLVADIAALLGQPRSTDPTMLLCGGLRFVSPTSWAERETPATSAQAERKTEELLNGDNNSEELHIVLLELLDEARKRGISIIGLRSPVAEDYRRVAVRFKTDEARAFVANLPLMAMLDFEYAYLARSELFADPDHLNARGAASFTPVVVDALEKLVDVPATGRRQCDTGVASRPRAGGGPAVWRQPVLETQP